MRNQSAQEITTPINGRHNGNILGTNDEYGVDEHTKDHEKEKRRTIGATCTHTHTNTICIWRWMCDVFTVFSLTFSSFASLLLLLCCYCCHHFSNRLALNRTHRTKRVSFSSHTHTHTHNTNRL